MTKLALQRPVLIFVLMMTAILFGLLTYVGMRKEQNPEVSFGTVTISTIYPGAGPDDINQLISRKVEEAVSGINGIQTVTSTSQEGVSSVLVQLEIGEDVDKALNDIRAKVDAIANDLPKDARKPQIAKINATSRPILNLGFTSKTRTSAQLRDLLQDRIRDRITQIPGVAEANILGGDVREIQIRVQKQKLLQYGVGISDVLAAVQSAAINVPSGKYITGDREFTVRVKSDFTRIEDARRVQVKVEDRTNPMSKARVVNLTDLAVIEDTVRERTTSTRLNGADSVVLAVQKAREGNALEITEKVKELIPELEKEYGVKVVKTYQEATYIEEGLADVQFALGFGIILVGYIVWLFLHDIRGTLIVATAIPTSIFASFIVMKIAGFTINTLSMLALSLAIGVLVDDAIVVLENIYRHLKMGEDPYDAAINGRAEIGTAALAITMADVVVFLPIGFAGGITGQFFKPMALTYVFAVLFSLFVSFTLTPLLAARWYKRGEDIEHPKTKSAMRFERRFGNLENAYRRGLEWSLRNRWVVFCSGNVVLFSIFMFIAGGAVGSRHKAFGEAIPELMTIVGKVALASIAIGALACLLNVLFLKRFLPRTILGGLLFAVVFVLSGMGGVAFQQWKQDAVFKFSFLPTTDALQVRAAIELPIGSNLAETDKVSRIVERAFLKHPAVKFTQVNVGRQAGAAFGVETNATAFAEVEGTLYEKQALLDIITGANRREKLRTVTANSVIADLTKEIGQIPGATVRVSAVAGFAFGSAIQLSLTSDNHDLLVATAVKIRERLAQNAVPGVVNPEITSKDGRPEIRLVPDYRKAADLGVDPSQIGAAVRTMYQGNDDVKFRENGREFDVRVMLDFKDRNDPDTLSTVPVTYRQGNPVYLSSLVEAKQEPGLSKIVRRNRVEEIAVNADLLQGYENGTVNALIADFLKKEKLVPEGVNFKPLGQADSQARESGFLMTAFFTGLLLVYFVLAILYNNWIYPFIIQLAQPQAIVGAFLALIIVDKAFSLIGFIGLVTLIGLVGKNAILLVDYTNTLRERGRSRHDALVESGPTRLRPIMMTTLALVLGTLPVAMAIGRGSEFRETIGITVIGGVALSTLLTLFVIPCSYTIFDDLSNGFAKFFNRPLPFGGIEGYAQAGVASEESSDAVEVK